MKKVGVVCDDYKIKTFRENLGRIGITDIEVKPLRPGISSLKFDVEEKDLEKVGRKIAQINSNASRSN